MLNSILHEYFGSSFCRGKEKMQEAVALFQNNGKGAILKIFSSDFGFSKIWIL